ncbi:MAG: NUDIX domain-containing protein [Solobacterium sp.]|nr:NUDIX domain-containing protein [Solobacterium sp.]
MEWFDITDEQGNPTGKIVDRETAHREGIMHRCADIWVVREHDGRTEVLLQKRSRNKDSFPGRYDTSSAGHIQAGDEPLPSAIREFKEELGIEARPEELAFAGTFRIKYEKEFYGRIFKDNEVAFVYVYQKEVDLQDIHVQEEEVENVAWFALDDVYQACLRKDDAYCVPLRGLELLMNYLKQK